MCDSQDAVFARLTATFGRGFESRVAHHCLGSREKSLEFFICNETELFQVILPALMKTRAYLPVPMHLSLF